MRHRSSRPVAAAVLLVALAGLGAGCGGGQDSAYQATIDDWHAERIRNLRAETGWLTLIGLHPLADGAHSLGSDPQNDIVLGAGPARIGEIGMAEGKVVFVPDTAVTVREFVDGAEGAPFDGSYGLVRSPCAARSSAAAPRWRRAALARTRRARDNR